MEEKEGHVVKEKEADKAYHILPEEFWVSVEGAQQISQVEQRDKEEKAYLWNNERSSSSWKCFTLAQ